MTSQNESFLNEGESNALVPVLETTSDYPPEPQNFGETPVFGTLTLLFEAIQNERRQDKRRLMLEKWFQLWRQRVGPNFYPVLRLILPHKDRERAVYHSKEANIAKALIAVMGIEKAPDAARLLNWKRPVGNQQSMAGDFPALAYEIMSKRSSVIEGDLRIDQLNQLLDDLSRKGSKLEHQKRIFSQLFLKCTPGELRWVIRIILKDLNVGVKETTVLGAFHSDAIAVFNSCSDLKRVAYQLWDPTHHSEETEKTVQMFRSFAPMLSKRPPKSLADIVKRYGGITFKAEEKLDGERIQLHKRGAQYFYSSRKSKDYTYLYGKHPGEGSLTPYIHDAFNPEVKECILDGEMLVWDPVSERYLPFGTLKQHAGETEATSKRQYSPRPCFKVFDLVYLNGKSLTEESLSYRKRNLNNVFTPVEGRLEIMQQFDLNTTKDIENLLQNVVETRGEGLIIKHPNSTYVLNGRVDNWIKLKPEYMDGQSETFDLLVVGGKYGTGIRGGGVSTLICGIRDDRPSAGSTPKWVSFSRLGSGLSFADFVTIRAKPWKEWGSKGPDFFMTAPRSHDDKGDVYLEPEDSFVVTVKAAEIISSDQYNLKLTLRFGRILRIREEFGPEDVATVSEVLEQIAAGKKRKQEAETSGANKRRKMGGRKKVRISLCFPVSISYIHQAIVSSAFQGAKTDSDTKSNIFSGKTFVVYPAAQAVVPYQKVELEQVIRANGGTIRSRRSGNPDEVLIYGGKNQPPDIKAIVRDGEQDIIYPQWILDSVKKKQVLPFRSKYIFHSTTQQGSDTEEDEQDDMEITQEGSDDQSMSSVANPSGSIHEDAPSPAMQDFEQAPHSEWIKVEPQDVYDMGKFAQDIPDDEVTDHEEPDEDEEENEGWVDLLSNAASAPPLSTIGETSDSMEYDQEKIFRHLVFYLDSPGCSRQNNLKVSTSNEKDIEERFTTIRKDILAHGGQVITDIKDPKLTHVVLDNDDLSRRIALMRLTEKPKRRRFVISDYIAYCIEEGTLADEDQFMP
ncbi:putative DNA ligase [Serendipita vermifera]|nr:putative DNA ligase [Serendipita vermifera]